MRTPGRAWVEGVANVTGTKPEEMNLDGWAVLFNVLFLLLAGALVLWVVTHGLT